MITTAAAQPVTNTGSGSGSAAGSAARPAAATNGTLLPAPGATFDINGQPGWPKVTWLYDIPSFKDATAKVVVHWFCSPKAAACVDDLARVVTMKENSNRVYVIAYIDGNKKQAKKLDPIRESEGVGRGTVAYGPGVTKLFKQLKVAAPASVIVDVDGKVSQVIIGSSPAELDARDAKVNALTAAIKEYSLTSEGPKSPRAGEKFTFKISVKLASWVKHSTKTPREFKVMTPKEIACDATTLRGDQVKIEGQTLTGAVTCSAPRGSYEVRGQLSFGYDAPAGAGLGTESANWKFEIK